MYDVSIIIPAYCTTPESVEWLGECIASALIQDCEVVVYNDGSPMDLDKYKSIVHTWVDGSINIGASHARNRAAFYATKTLLYPLDGDDRLKPGAISKLLGYWDGEVPVYSDVAKFGVVHEPHYTLLDFDCDNIIKHVGFSSVNVLHPRSYWEELGGWDEWLEFYEDGYYNARLFSRWCGIRCPEPLVEYRQHGGQRTKKYKKQSAQFTKVVMDKIRRLDMACKSCSKSRSIRATASSVPVQNVQGRVDVNMLPGEVKGRVLVQYIGGKGKAKHYYRGPKTKYPYKVIYGEFLYVDPTDAVMPAESGSFFVKVIRPEPVEKVVTVVTPAAEHEQEGTAKLAVVEEPKPEPEQEKVIRKPVKVKDKKPV